MEGKKQFTPENEVDHEYLRNVSNFLVKLKEESFPEESKESKTYKEFFEANIDSLYRLAKNPEKIRPEDVSLAISQLAGLMNAYSYPIGERISPEEEYRYKKAKELFMETVEKIFPDAGEVKNIATTIIQEKKILEENGVSCPFQHSSDEASTLLKENPDELLKGLEDAIFQIQDNISKRAFVSFKESEKGNTELAKASMSLYNLQIARDMLVKRIYSDLFTPAEIIEIREIKKRLEV